MSWLSRFLRGPSREAASEEPEESTPAPVERAAPGVAALFDGLADDGTHAVLDLGTASESSFHLYSRYARRIRFAGLLTDPPDSPEWRKALLALQSDAHAPYDVLVGWNILDRLPPGDRESFMKSLEEIAAPGARLYVVIDASDDPGRHPIRFTLHALDRVSQQTAGPEEPRRQRLLPAEVERLLRPFVVIHAFTLRLGLREYVAVKQRKTGRDFGWEEA